MFKLVGVIGFLQPTGLNNPVPKPSGRNLFCVMGLIYLRSLNNLRSEEIGLWGKFPRYFHILVLLNFKRKIWTWTRTRTRTSGSLVWRSIIELSWFYCQFTFKLSSWNNCNYCQAMWSMTLAAIYWSLIKLTLLLNKYNIQIKLLVKTSLIICAFVHLHC